MPGLIRGVARTAVVAGTATAVSNRVSRRQGNRWAAQEQQQYEQQLAQQEMMQQQAAAAVAAATPPPPPPAAPAAAPSQTDRIAALKDLAALHEQGILSDDEFAAEKARILAS